ncbi:MAG: hypothetical protein LBG43_03805 [Treponema sp.]|jgi:hypothetical protein|nr:hypothetical protein [Treponema sp.]
MECEQVLNSMAAVVSGAGCLLRRCRLSLAGAFAADMEEIVDVRQRPRGAGFPVAGVDEEHRRLPGESGTPIPASSGKESGEDGEYVRGGSRGALDCAMNRQCGKLTETRRQRQLTGNFPQMAQESN